MLNTTLCYVTRGNEVLMLHRVKKKNDINKDKWIGIGGKLSDTYEGEYMYLFTADGFEGELSECPEGDLQWVSREFVNQLPTWEGDKIFLDLLWQDAPFFLLKLRYEGEKLAEAVLNGKKIR